VQLRYDTSFSPTAYHVATLGAAYFLKLRGARNQRSGQYVEPFASAGAVNLHHHRAASAPLSGVAPAPGCVFLRAARGLGLLYQTPSLFGALPGEIVFPGLDRTVARRRRIYSFPAAAAW